MSSPGSVPNSPFAPAVAALAAWSTFVALRIWQIGQGDIGAFVVAGTDWTDASSGLPLVDGPGYDGQFFHRLAVDPFALADRVAGTLLDSPVRYNRIGYPLVSRLFMVPGLPADWALVVVNLVAVALLGAIGGAMARRAGQHAMWGLVLPLYFGFAFSIARDLAEVVAAAAFIAGLWAAHRQRYALGAVALSLAVISRETIVVAVFAIGVVDLVALVRRRRGLEARDAVWIVPGMVVLTWQVAARDRWGETPLLAGDAGRVRPPGAALIEQLPTLVDPSWIGDGWLQAVHALEVIVLLGVVTWALVRCRSLDAGSPLVPALIGLTVSALIIDVPEGIWLDRNDLRMFADLYVVAMAVLLLTRVRLVVPAVAVGLCTALAGLSFLAGA